MTVAQLAETRAAEPDQVLTKAAIRAARLLKMSNRELAQVLGVSEPTVSRAARGAALPATGKALEMAALFVRLYRALDAITGGDDKVSAAWLRAENAALGGPPIRAMATAQGLVGTLAYLDARRALV